MDDTFSDVLRPHLPFLGEDQRLVEQDQLRDLGLNSMQAIEVLFAVEDTYGVSLPDDQLNDETFASAGSLWHAVEVARGSGEDR
jgi:acyl carrier protein